MSTSEAYAIAHKLQAKREKEGWDALSKLEQAVLVLSGR